MILGVKIIRNESGILLSQEYYAEKILRKFDQFDKSSLSSPYDYSVQLNKHKGDLVSQSKYAQIIESLLHLMNYTKPGIAYAGCRLRNTLIVQ